MPISKSKIEPSKQANLQGRSPLLSVPAEIRLMILRELLTCGAPIEHKQIYQTLTRGAVRKSMKTLLKPRKRVCHARKAKHNDIDYCEEEIEPEELPTKVVRGYKLTPAILGTCQQFLREGWDVLYRENPLVINIRRGGAPFWRRDKHPAVTVPAHFRSSLIYISQAQVYVDAEAEEFSSRFHQAEVYLDVSDFLHEGIMQDIFRLLNPVFKDKIVRAHVIGARRNANRDSRSGIFRLLRCKDFSITGIPEDLAEKISQVVKSDAPVVDLAKPASNMEETLNILEKEHGRLWRINTNEELIELVYSADKESFLRFRGEIMEKFKEYQQRIERELYADDGW